MDLGVISLNQSGGARGLEGIVFPLLLLSELMVDGR